MWPFGKSKTAVLSDQLAATQSQLSSAMDQIQELNNSVTVTSGDVESMMDLLNSGASAHGEPVNRNTAMKVSAVYACVRLIAGSIGSLPAHIYERDGKKKEIASNHPYYKALHDSPNPMLTAVVFWECVVTYMLLNGNSYALIGRNRNGDMISLTPLKSERVVPDTKNGRLIYGVVFDDGIQATYDQDDILHTPNIGWNGKEGLSTLRSVLLNAVGGALAADKYSATFFANDATPRGYIKFPENLNKDQAKIIRDYWFDHHQHPDKRHLPAFIPSGGEFKEITMKAEDAQLLQTRSFNVADIARIFGVPPHMIGHMEKSTAWGTGLEQQSIGFLIFTLRPLLTRIEQEVNRKIIRSDKYFFRFNVDGLLRGDIKSRYEAYQVGLGGNQQPGFLTVNEVRELEDRAPIDGGDKLYKPLTGETDGSNDEPPSKPSESE
ncbi:MAG: phage portal protein [Saccharospirillaceae bacterium]|nr:phage portal protein [Saccharospirillaceae bacterium]